MFKLPDRQIVLADLSEFQREEIADVTGLYGRDSLAEQIERDVDSWSLQALGDDGPREHLGASVVGHYCERYIFQHFRWMHREAFKPRMLRLFWRGHREEDIIITMLQGIGFQIMQLDTDGRQLRIARDDAEGHFGGSCDSLCMLPTRYGLPPFWILLEIKTANTRYFKDIKNLGVFKAKERYYKQMCVYAHKLTQQQKYGSIDYGLFVCSNKNDDDLDIEFLALDHSIGEEEIRKAEVITQMYNPPNRIGSASHWECKICPMHGLCHLNEAIERNCRSCRFAQPVANGKWHCHNYNQQIPEEFLIKGCGAWESLPK